MYAPIITDIGTVNTVDCSFKQGDTNAELKAWLSMTLRHLLTNQRTAGEFTFHLTSPCLEAASRFMGSASAVPPWWRRVTNLGSRSRSSPCSAAPRWHARTAPPSAAPAAPSASAAPARSVGCSAERSPWPSAGTEAWAWTGRSPPWTSPPPAKGLKKYIYTYALDMHYKWHGDSLVSTAASQQGGWISLRRLIRQKKKTHARTHTHTHTHIYWSFIFI